MKLILDLFSNSAMGGIDCRKPHRKQVIMQTRDHLDTRVSWNAQENR